MKNESVCIMKGAESVLKLRENSEGVLLLHGFMGNPSEMKYLGNKIYDAGYSVSIPRYPGHGTSIFEMTETSGNDWFTAAREAYLELASHCEKVSLVGLSMGGLFALLISSEFSIDRICLISVPRKLKSIYVYFSPFLAFFKKVLPSDDNNHGINSPEARALHVSYLEGIPVRQTWDLHKMIKRAMKALPGILIPVLIIQSTGDDVIPQDSAEYISERIGSLKKETKIFNKSSHVVTVDYDRDETAETVIDFLAN